jgi:hypothetical protein
VEEEIVRRGSTVMELLFRACATVVSLIGLGLLVDVLLGSATGALGRELFPQSSGSLFWESAALALTLPVPLHVMSIGLILQKRWLAAAWRRVAWVCIVASGVWLGAALLLRALLLH